MGRMGWALRRSGPLTRVASVVPRGSLWRHRDFLKLWAGQSASALGSQVTRLALPLTAVLMLGATPGQMGALQALEWAPNALFGLLVGVWVDRLPRRPLLMAANLGLALVVGSVPVAAWLGHVRFEQLYAVAFATGALSLCFGVAYAAYLPSLVGRERLVEANGKVQASGSVAAVAGPGLTGVLVQLLTAPVAMAFDACSYVVAALSLALIRAAEPARVRPEGRPGIRGEIGEGLRAVLGHPVLRTLAWASLVWNLFGSAGNVVWILFATREVGISAAVLGSLFAVAGGGAVLGALLAQPAAERYGVGRAVVGSMCAITVANAILPFAGGPAPVAVAMLEGWALVSGIAIPINLVGVASLRQAIAPGALQGRVNATLQFAAALMVPAGSLLGGGLGELIGTRATLALTAGASLLVSIGLILSPVPAIRELPAAMELTPSSV